MSAFSILPVETGKPITYRVPVKATQFYGAAAKISLRGITGAYDRLSQLNFHDIPTSCGIPVDGLIGGKRR